MPHSVITKYSEYTETLDFVVGEGSVGQRLDQFLGQFGQDDYRFSRSIFQSLIRRDLVLVDGKPQKSKYKLKQSEKILVFLPPPEPVDLVPEKVDFEILHEDADVIVISKPPGLVVHPACGNMTGTLVHGLLYHCKELPGICGQIRPGIVHRLDKFTSGVMVVAKSDSAQHSLTQQFKSKSIKKTYLALLDGILSDSCGTVSTMIGRHPIHRKKMAVREFGGKEAVTHWKVLKHFEDFFTLAEIKLETGRTHQIRVHMKYCGAPVAGDLVYGKKNERYYELGITRQYLHASELSFFHPGIKKTVKFYAPLLADMNNTFKKLVS